MTSRFFKPGQLERLKAAFDITVAEGRLEQRTLWKEFLSLYVSMMDTLTKSEDYTSEEIATLDETITKCYAALMKVAGMKACTNYFHLLGSGHVMWLTQRYGNLWRWRNEGAEGQHSVLSLRYNKFNSTIAVEIMATVPTRTSKRYASLSRSLELVWHGSQCGNYV